MDYEVVNKMNDCLMVAISLSDDTTTSLREKNRCVDKIIHYAIFTDPRHIFMLSRLENPILLEHDSFTELLLAIFHLSEELVARDTLVGLPQSDYEHLAGDIKRAYTLLIREWLAYMMHLKDNYPYLFSLVIRTNPLDADASPVVT